MQRTATLLLCVALALCASVAAKADKTVKISPVPDWVEPVAIPAPNPKRIDQVSGGIYFLLNDMQQIKTAAGSDYYGHLAYRITDRAGLENAARIDNVFDPDNDTFSVNFIHIVRDGAVLNALNPDDITILRREANLERGLFDGRLTADIQLRDVRVGDIVEYGLTWSRRTPLWPGDFFTSIPTRFAVPLGRQSYRLIWPDDRVLNIRTAAAVTPQVTHSGGQTIYKWTIDDADQIVTENNMPNGYDPSARVYLSSMADWRQVSQWAFNLYNKPNELPADFAARVDAIAKAHPDPAERITEAVRLIEDTIRYVSISINEGSYIPRPAAAIVKDGFGDCKDKSTLLAAVLNRLGVEAYPALTMIRDGKMLSDVQPAITAFDHMIVLVRFNGEDHWIDPTLSHQGGRFPAIAYPSYGYALPIIEHGADLLPVRFPPPAEATTVARQNYTWNADTGAIDMVFRITYSAQDADLFRGIYANLGREKYDRTKLDYLQKIYKDLAETKPLSVQDDREKNEVETLESYSLAYQAVKDNQIEHRFPVYPTLLRGFFAELPATRQHPYALNETLNRRNIVTLDIPTLGKFAIRDATLFGKGLIFTRKVHSEADSLVLDYGLKFVTDRVSAADFPKLRADIRKMDTGIYAWIDINRGFYRRYYQDFPRIVLGLFAVILLPLAIFGARHGLRADRDYAAKAAFYPVAVGKFLPMNIATFGAYGFFWSWKCWRWLKHTQGLEILPFWRAAFMTIWWYPLFGHIRARNPAMALPAWIGVLGATLFLGARIGASLAQRLGGGLELWVALLLISYLAALPLVIGVNRLNREDPAALKLNSRFNGWNIAALIVGGLLWALMLLGLAAIRLRTGR